MKKIIVPATLFVALSTASFAQSGKNEKNEEKNEIDSKVHVP